MKYIEIVIFDETWFLEFPNCNTEKYFTNIKDILVECRLVEQEHTPSNVITTYFKTDHENLADIISSCTQLSSFPLEIYRRDKYHFIALAENHLKEEFFVFNVLNVLISFISYILVDKNIFPFHCASLINGKDAVLLTGRSGVGKSTCYSRAKGKWGGASDDLALLKLDQDSCSVIPFPTWSNFTPDAKDDRRVWDISKEYNLQKIFILGFGNNEVKNIDTAQALMCINSQISIFYKIFDFKLFERDEYIQKMKRIFSISNSLIQLFHIKKLEHSLDGKFWELIDADTTVTN